MNRFEEAIRQNELLDFALGALEYYLRDRDYDEHWVLGSWINYILPYCRDNDCDAPVREMFQALIRDSTLSQQDRLDALLYHVCVFYYLVGEKRFSDKDLIKDLESAIGFEVESLKNKLVAGSDSNKLDELKKTVALIKSTGGLNDYSLE